MKHCYFALTYNEIPYITQKMDFLYENFAQLIFFDLGVLNGPFHFSTDGTHEFLKEYPDPENKITLIEETDLSKYPVITGYELQAKRQMSVACSLLVRDDIDIVWTMDIDEFFGKELIDDIERTAQQFPEIQSFKVQQYLFWKDLNTILATPDSNTMSNEIRVSRHQKNRIYLHCNMQRIQPIKIVETPMYHFSWIDEERYRFKTSLHNITNSEIQNYHRNYLKNIWNCVDTNELGPFLFGYPDMHPNPFLKGYGIKRFPGKLPKYIHQENMMKMIRDKTII